MLAVASRLCGLHAQVLSSALFTLWARVEDLDRQAVQRALWEERTPVKTWAMRGTLHLLPTGDLPLWHAALSRSRRYRKPGLWRRFGLTLEELDELTEAIGAALDGCLMTREELAQKVGRLTGSKKFAAKLMYGSWGTILKPGGDDWQAVLWPEHRTARPVHSTEQLGRRCDSDPGFASCNIGRHSPFPFDVRSRDAP
jgi:hypothetical protein